MKFLFACILSCGLIHFTLAQSKINGVSMVAPNFEIGSNHYQSVKNLNANWVAIIPYGFCGQSQPKVSYNHLMQWWGEKSEGTKKSIEYAKENNLKVMLKPHLWTREHGWAGELDFDRKEDLSQWQNSYSQYILEFASMAEETQVDLFVIGTELRKLTKRDPQFFYQLIRDIRKVYDGPLTYAANWDNYENIPFWTALDFIGIDAYFPTCDQKTPAQSDINKSYDQLKKQLIIYASMHAKPILFTEFGFRSMDYACRGHWDVEHQRQPVNLTAQTNAYQSLFDSFWEEDWFAGGFLWKWYYNHGSAGGSNDSNFTPQNKPAETIIRSNFLLHN